PLRAGKASRIRGEHRRRWQPASVCVGPALAHPARAVLLRIVRAHDSVQILEQVLELPPQTLEFILDAGDAAVISPLLSRLEKRLLICYLSLDTRDIRPHAVLVHGIGVHPRVCLAPGV